MDSLDREASFPNHLGRAAGREYADILLGKTFGQVEETGLVVDRQNSCDKSVSSSKRVV